MATTIDRDTDSRARLRRYERVACRGALFVAGGFVLAALFIALFARPSGDDFAYAVLVRREGFLRSQRLWYNGWTGRFAGTALISLFTRELDFIRMYWIAPTTVILAILGCCRVGLKSAIPRASGTTLTSATLLVGCAFMVMIPSIGDSVYWMSGAFNHMLPAALSVVLFAMLVSVASPCGRLTVSIAAVRLAACVLAALLVGCNELLACALLVVLAAAVWLVYRRDHRLNPTLIAVLLFSLASMAVVMAAPGNQARTVASLHARHQLIASALLAITVAASYALRWATNPALWGCTLLIAHLRSASGSTETATARPLASPVQIAVVTMIALWASLFPYLYATGGVPSAQELSGAVTVFFLGWLVLAIRAASVIPESWSRAIRQGRALLPAYVLLLVGIVGSSTALDVLLGIYRAPRYCAAMSARFATLERARRAGKQFAATDVVRVTQTPLHASTLSSDPNFWENVVYAEYYDLKGVVALIDDRNIPMTVTNRALWRGKVYEYR